jgi:hypothetical protein
LFPSKQGPWPFSLGEAGTMTTMMVG